MLKSSDLRDVGIVKRKDGSIKRGYWNLAQRSLKKSAFPIHPEVFKLEENCAALDHRRLRPKGIRDKELGTRKQMV